MGGNWLVDSGNESSSRRVKKTFYDVRGALRRRFSGEKLFCCNESKVLRRKQNITSSYILSSPQQIQSFSSNCNCNLFRLSKYSIRLFAGVVIVQEQKHQFCQCKYGQTILVSRIVHNAYNYTNYYRFLQPEITYLLCRLS